ncbi:MAG: efflux RND transporter periplasmic adaptor subunit [Terrimicrobiaceae bacterium]|nr:efflux RND transporter periplasmic adaptor subunit [Terrimicrobiaceae bacterium]
MGRLTLLLLVFVLGAGLLQADQAPIEAKGLLRPVREVRLASRSQGVIRSVVEEGTKVDEGATVVQLEDARERIEVEKQKRVLEMREFEGRAGRTLDTSGAISRMEGMEKAINHEVAKLLLAEANEFLERRRVVAPFAGVVTERMRGVGEAVDEFVPVLTMVDLSRLYFETYLPAARVRDVVEGQPAEVRIETFPERVFPGTVKLISPVVSPASSEFRVRIEVDNSDGQLRSGLPGMCRILPPTMAEAAED